MSTIPRKKHQRLPKGEEAEAELARIRRNERRAIRRAKKKAAEEGIPWDESMAPKPVTETDDSEVPPSVAFEGIPTGEEMRSQLWSAFGALGGVAGLVAWGRRYPKEFYAVWARVCIPKGGPTEAAPNSLESLLAQLGDD